MRSPREKIEGEGLTESYRILIFLKVRKRLAKEIGTSHLRNQWRLEEHVIMHAKRWKCFRGEEGSNQSLLRGEIRLKSIHWAY